jgi:hypothetical protein
MASLHTKIKPLITPLLISALAACDAGEENKEINSDTPDSNHAADIKAACASLPDLPFCNSEPRPGFAKFKLGKADAVRWTGNDGCRKLDFRTGRQNDEHRFTKVAGEINYTCDDEIHYEFVYRQHTKMPESSESWTSAFRPLTTLAARELLRSCSWESTPEPSAVMGGWWKANNTYAENMFLNYVSPLVYATRLLPFDDDNFDRVGSETLDGIETIQFRNAEAAVWMIDDDSGRPLRVVRGSGRGEVHFTEWGQPFSARIPADIRSLSEVCDVR